MSRRILLGRTYADEEIGGRTTMPWGIERNGEPTDRLFSLYDVGGREIHIITELDRSATTVLFPEEY